MNNEEKQEIKFVEVTWKKVFKVYCRIFWQGYISLIIAIAALNIVRIIVFFFIFRIEYSETMETIIVVVSIFIGFFFGLKRVLQKKYSDFRIALIEK